MGEQLKYIQIAGRVVPLLIVAVGMASWIFSLRADIDVVIDEVAEISLDTARVNATSDEADQELLERVEDLGERVTEIERVQSVITNEYRTIMAEHNRFVQLVLDVGTARGAFVAPVRVRGEVAEAAAGGPDALRQVRGADVAHVLRLGHLALALVRARRRA